MPVLSTEIGRRLRAIFDAKWARSNIGFWCGAGEAEEIIPRKTKDAPGESEKKPKGKSPETPSIFEKKELLCKILKLNQ